MIYIKFDEMAAAAAYNGLLLHKTTFDTHFQFSLA